MIKPLKNPLKNTVECLLYVIHLQQGFFHFGLGYFFFFPACVPSVFQSLCVAAANRYPVNVCVCVCAVCISVCVSDFRLSVFDELVCLVQCVVSRVSVRVSDLQKDVVAVSQYLTVECVWSLCFSPCVRPAEGCGGSESVSDR